MSFFKFFGNSGQKGSKSKKENSKPKGKDEIWPELTPEEKAEAEKLGFSADRKARNLSISRSGRHKYKAKQRSVLVGQEDLYSTHNAVSKGAPASSSSQQPSTSHSQGGAASSHNRAGSYGNQGSLGRSSGGHCAVEESTKRYGQTKMASQPTAV